MIKKCKGCSKLMKNPHPNKKFHSRRCKDRYWNSINPRGYARFPHYQYEEEEVNYPTIDDI